MSAGDARFGGGSVRYGERASPPHAPSSGSPRACAGSPSEEESTCRATRLSRRTWARAMGRGFEGLDGWKASTLKRVHSPNQSATSRLSHAITCHAEREEPSVMRPWSSRGGAAEQSRSSGSRAAAEQRQSRATRERETAGEMQPRSAIATDLVVVEADFGAVGGHALKKGARVMPIGHLW